MKSAAFRLFSVAIVCLLATSLCAQVSTSRVEGTITDPSGAVVADAAVTVTNEATGVKYETRSGSSGIWAVPSLPPGSYSVIVSRQGFQTFTSKGNVLTVGVPLVVNASLRVGAAGQVVEVEANYQRIETTNAVIGDVMTEKQVKNLPLNGRNPLTLLTLEPGVVQRTAGSAGSGTHVFGSRDRSHNVTVDGIDAN